MADHLEGSLQGSDQVNCLEDWCSLETDFEISGHSSRPASTMSFNSWTFSPIAEEVNSASNGLDDQSDLSACSKQGSTVDTSLPEVCHTGNHATSAQPSFPPEIPPMPAISQTLCEYNMFPGNMTYHHSVNIHNYMGSYYMAPRAWSPDYGTAPQHQYGYSNYMTPAYSHQRPAETAVAHQQAPVLPSINRVAASVDLTRCSTPDYLVAMSSTHQPLTPGFPPLTPGVHQMSASSFSFSDSLDGKSTSLIQDSGYHSDISASPIIQFQVKHLLNSKLITSCVFVK